MKKNFMKFISVILSLALVFSIGCTGVSASDNESSTVTLPTTEELAGAVTDT